MSLGEVIFVVICLVVALGALGAVLSNSLIYAVFFLLLTMGGIGGLYIYLKTPFLAMMQILIYLGAVGVLLIFAVMLAGPFWRRPKERGPFLKGVAGLGVSLLSFILFWRVLRHHPWEVGPQGEVSTSRIGRAILDRYPFAFELISLLIVASILGAIMLGVLSRQGPPKAEED
ncbi:MAG: hypothetical protein DRG55_03585 [Deltaproteobacteria bacterium]|nr:MAG: hypothetical protein DRG55_03585 [Deltaproteobacteria bacterium]